MGSSPTTSRTALVRERLLAALGLLLLGACASVNPMPRTHLGRINADLDQVQLDLEQARGNDALFRLQRVWEVEGLSPEDRNRAASLLVDAAPLALESELEGEVLIELAELELPRRTRIQLWVAGAQRLLAQGERKDSYKAIKDLEELYPSHYMRGPAGDVVAEAGFSLAADRRSHHLLFKYRDEAPELLQYLTLTFPSNPNCDLAYATLGEIYEEERRWREAIQAHRDLLLFHADSRFVTYSEARVPYLRTLEVQSTRYDRGAMIEAEAECEAWLEHHTLETLDAADEPLHGHVNELLHEVRRRLVLNDLHVSSFYATIGNRYGAELHAERGLELAQAIAEPELVLRCEELITLSQNLTEDLDPARVIGTGGPGLGPEEFGITAELPPAAPQREREPLPIEPDDPEDEGGPNLDQLP